EKGQSVGFGLADAAPVGEEPVDEQVVLEQAPAAAPAKLAQRPVVDHGGTRHHTVRLTSSSRILPIARVGLSDLGHTSMQFMIVWQRNSRYGCSRLSRRSLVAWSRLSAMNR